MSLVLYTIPPEYNWSRNPIRFKAGTDKPLTTAGLYIQCRVSFATMGGTLQEVVRFPLTPDAQGLVEVDLQRIVDKLMDATLPSQTATVQQIAKHSGTLEVTFVEYSIDNPTGTSVTNAGSFTIIKGGIAYQRWQGQAWFANWYTTRKILSWFGLQRTVNTWQQLWLSYLHLLANDTGYVVKTQVYFTDGTNTAGPTFNFPSSGVVTENYLYHIPAGYTQLGIGAVNTAKVVHYYTVGVYKSTTLKSELITCLMDYTPDYRQIQFVFFNSLGGLDTVCLKGEQNEQFGRDYDLIDLNTSRSNVAGTILPAQSAMNRVLEQQTFKGNIGVTDEIQVQDLRRELFLSRSIYTPKNSRWWPVNVVDTTVETGELISQLRELDIEWRYSWANENYTPDWADLGAEPAPTISCPVGTIDATETSASLSFSHQPGPVDRYRVGLFKDSDDSQVGDFVTYEIPFGSTITTVVSGLMPSTAYYWKILMDVTSTGQTVTCDNYAVTTDAAGDPPPPSTGLMGITLSPSLPGYSHSLSTISSPTAPITLTPPASYLLTKFNTPAAATHPVGTFSISISYSGMLNNTISITDATGAVQSAVVSYSGTVTFTGVVINSSVTTQITVS